MKLIDGKALSKNILLEIKQQIPRLSFVPVFCDVLVGEDPASVQYVNMKAKRAEELGIKFHRAEFPKDISTEELIEEIRKINKIKNMCGVIVQLPLPDSLDTKMVLDAIDPTLDVDALGSVENEKFYRGESKMGLPTALACIAMLESSGISLSGKEIVVLGKGELVGKPVAALLEHKGFKPKVVGVNTTDKEVILKNADIIISGIGKGSYIKGDMIKEGAVIIDAGTSESIERMTTGEPGVSIVGDVDIESVKEVAGCVSPVPGGVGPVTVAMLFQNVLKVAKAK